MEPERKQALAEFIAQLNLTYAVEFVPQSKSRNAGKDPCLNWRVTLARPGRVSELATDYMQGIGHVPNHGSYTHNGLKSVAESGKLIHKAHERGKSAPAPELTDVLYCLAADSDVLNHATFESWASEFGYDVDSRKAEATYRGCLEIALKLRAMLGDAPLEQLRALFQDY